MQTVQTFVYLHKNFRKCYMRRNVCVVYVCGCKESSPYLSSESQMIIVEQQVAIHIYYYLRQHWLVHRNFVNIFFLLLCMFEYDVLTACGTKRMKSHLWKLFQERAIVVADAGDDDERDVEYVRLLLEYPSLTYVCIQ